MLIVSSYELARGCVAARCGSSQYPQFDPCSPQSLQQLSGRASDKITEGRGFKSHLVQLGLGFSESTFLLEFTQYHVVAISLLVFSHFHRQLVFVLSLSSF